jgi:hypothetical protein
MKERDTSQNKWIQLAKLAPATETKGPNLLHTVG